jgi:hypothetical protein
MNATPLELFSKSQQWASRTLLNAFWSVQLFPQLVGNVQLSSSSSGLESTSTAHEPQGRLIHGYMQARPGARWQVESTNCSGLSLSPSTDLFPTPT